MSNSWKQIRDTKSVQKTLNVGHQWLTPVKEDLYLSIITKSDRRATASQLSPDLYAAARNRNFKVTAYRRLPDKGSFIISPTACGLLTSEHRRNRLNWGRDHRHWIRDLWGTVVFPFESWLSANTNPDIYSSRENQGCNTCLPTSRKWDYHWVVCLRV